MADHASPLDPQRRALLEHLAVHRVAGVIIGGAAIQSYRPTYATDDVDITPARDEQNAPRPRRGAPAQLLPGPSPRPRPAPSPPRARAQPRSGDDRRGPRPWREDYGPEWTRSPVARVRYTQRTGVWVLYARDYRGHPDPPASAATRFTGPSAKIGVLIEEIDRDPTCIFWG